MKETTRVASSPPSNITERLQEIEDRQAIIDTLYRYCHALDYRLLDEIMDCYTSDPVLDIHSLHHAPIATGTKHSKGTIHRGREQVLAFYRTIGPATDPSRNRHNPSHHQISNARVIDFSRDSAKTVCYMESVSLKEGLPQLGVYGRYLDELTRESDGVWRIHSRIIEIEEVP